MKTIINPIALVLLMASVSGAWAHSAEEHMKNAEEADCSAMEGMDMSNMDENDPVMQAMMKKCMKQMHASDDGDASTAEHKQEDMNEGDAAEASGGEHDHNH